jgi:hypothetical protein
MFQNKLAAIYSISRIGIAFIWLYHGLVPKLIFQHATELELVAKGPVIHSAETTVLIAGVIEVVLGCLVLFLWHHKWPAQASVAGFSFLLLGAVVMSPGHAIHAFNPITLTVSAILLGLINWLSHDDPTDNNDVDEKHRF